MNILHEIEDDEILDDSVASFIDASYWQEEGGILGRKMLAAISWLLPCIQPEGQSSLPQGARAAKGTARRAPGAIRLPLPEQIVYALAMVMACLGMRGGGGWDRNSLRFSASLVPAAVGADTALAEARDIAHAGLASHHLGRDASARGLDPKQGPRVRRDPLVDNLWLVAVLMAKRPRSLVGLNRGVMGVEPDRFAILFHRAQSILRIPQLLGPQQLYVIRHSGARADWINGRRQRQAIKNRGRWTSDSSLRRKGDRVAEQFDRCSPALQQLAMLCKTSLSSVLLERARP